MTEQLKPVHLNRPTWVEIDGAALAHNVKQIRSMIGERQLMAVVKANAYGHGATLIAPYLLQAGVDRLAVASLGEALELRQQGITAPILVLGYTPAWLAQEAVAHAITTTVFETDTIHALAAAAEAMGKRAVVHLKINSGMNRLGVLPGAAPRVLAELREQSALTVEGIFTHFATADLADKQFAYLQLQRFVSLLEQLTQAGLRPPLAHAANSAAVLTMPESYLDMVRCGIALYGLHPDPTETRVPPSFQPVLRWKAQIAQVLDVAPGESVGYGQEFIAQSPVTIAVIPIGYADGFPRRPSHWGHVLIHGQPAPLIGRVCMDQAMVDVTHLQTRRAVRQGDEVVIIGQQGEATLDVDTIAERLQTNNYDVVSRIMARVPRVYLLPDRAEPIH